MAVWLIAVFPVDVGLINSQAPFRAPELFPHRLAEFLTRKGKLAVKHLGISHQKLCQFFAVQQVFSISICSKVNHRAFAGFILQCIEKAFHFTRSNFMRMQAQHLVSGFAHNPFIRQ